MCSRFTQYRDQAWIVERFTIDHIEYEINRRYNIAPSQKVALVTHHIAKRSLVGAQWGLTPTWASDTGPSGLINARSETISSKPSFRDAFRHRRCLIPADGYYEWRSGPGGKTPMYIHREDDQPFAFAGLWEPASEHDPSPATCTIITTESNTLLRDIHPRMPVILNTEDEAAWLDQSTRESHRHELLRPFDPSQLAYHPVARRVGRSDYDDPQLIEHVDSEPGTQGELFS